MPGSASNDRAAELLGAIRHARFGNTVYCPRCSAERVVGWGSFGDRRRYRCRICGRTFSDLTGTPAAYSKKLLDWPAYSRALGKSLSVRRAAAHVGIHRCTAFRWRHALLGGLRARDSEKLAGWIEVGSLWFAYSEKGRSPTDRAPRTHGLRHSPPCDDLGANVLLACDRRGGIVTAVAGLSNRRSITHPQIERVLAARIDGRPRCLASHGRFGPVSLFAHRSGGTFFDTRPDARRSRLETVHLETVRKYAARLVGWLVRFQGVATRYLDNYLMWHRYVDRPWLHAALVGALPGLLRHALVRVAGV